VIINPEKCNGCRICIPYCPGEAMRFSDRLKKVQVSQKKCFECGVCRATVPCPTAAFEEPELSYERQIRKFFSNPKATHKLTGVPGRGTEESKTNDVTGRVSKDEVGICIEMGRPVAGCTFKDISFIAENLFKRGVTFERQNPLYAFMDEKTGKMPEALLGARIVSAILEIRVKRSDFAQIITDIIRFGRHVDTVFSLGIICRYNQDNQPEVQSLIDHLRIASWNNVKINVGLGKPLIP